MAVVTRTAEAGAFTTAGAHSENRTRSAPIPTVCTTIVLNGQARLDATRVETLRLWRCSVTLRDDLLARQVSGLPRPSPSRACKESNLVDIGFGIRSATSASNPWRLVAVTLRSPPLDRRVSTLADSRGSSALSARVERASFRLGDGAPDPRARANSLG